MRKKIIALISIVLISIVVCLYMNNLNTDFSNGQNTDTKTTYIEETEESTKNDYETKAINILDSTSFIDSIDSSYVQYGLCSDITFGQLLAGMFEDPKLDISETKTIDGDVIGYDITVSGYYRDTPNGYYTNEGNAYITINLTNGICTLTGDHYFKSAATNYAFAVTGYY